MIWLAVSELRKAGKPVPGKERTGGGLGESPGGGSGQEMKWHGDTGSSSAQAWRAGAGTDLQNLSGIGRCAGGAGVWEAH